MNFREPFACLYPNLVSVCLSNFLVEFLECFLLDYLIGGTEKIKEIIMNQRLHTGGSVTKGKAGYSARVNFPLEKKIRS